jgi:hypothetical protein
MAPIIDYDQLGQAKAKALRQNPPVNRWSDFKAVESRAAFTDTQANS